MRIKKSFLIKMLQNRCFYKYGRCGTCVERCDNKFNNKVGKTIKKIKR